MKVAVIVKLITKEKEGKEVLLIMILIKRRTIYPAVHNVLLGVTKEGLAYVKFRPNNVEEC